MRRSCKFFTLVFFLVTTFSGLAATGKVVKVLPHFLDLKGRHTLSPSLYDRDAYQAELRKHPEKRSGVRFDVQWRARSAVKGESAVLRVELRGSAKGDLPTQTTLETPVAITGAGHWAKLTLNGDAYQQFGEITAWRVTLWAGEEMIGEQKSFLW